MSYRMRGRRCRPLLPICLRRIKAAQELAPRGDAGRQIWGAAESQPRAARWRIFGVRASRVLLMMAALAATPLASVCIMGCFPGNISPPSQQAYQNQIGNDRAALVDGSVRYPEYLSLYVGAAEMVSVQVAGEKVTCTSGEGRAVDISCASKLQSALSGQIQVGGLFRLHLSSPMGQGIAVRLDSEEAQNVIGLDDSSTWVWSVLANKAGYFELTLSVEIDRADTDVPLKTWNFSIPIKVVLPEAAAPVERLGDTRKTNRSVKVVQIGLPILAPAFLVPIGMILVKKGAWRGASMALRKGTSVERIRLRREAAGSNLLANPPEVDGNPNRFGLMGFEVDALASAFQAPSAATNLLRSAGLRPEEFLSFHASANAKVFWREVSVELEHGRAPGGAQQLLAAAALLYPANSAFQTRFSGCRFLPGGGESVAGLE
ncbi:effector-associated domain EAD1-containing protein [Frankia sp. AgB32]|uniref:effector-associated domain EAD1-containing protein n=1 Tax=Frankia sp. AgB32 TaxID=631119 RepID=UPI00200DA8CA|nr:effector-associated domain EAD1-containing protein [Frankia sp. AgB32]MCK9896831.1 effector-associated domain EAD1-containing protein [Frankia sp. AgB32]